MKTLMVMAGGTGGHIFPGIAVAEVLQSRGWRIVWLGNPDGMEARIVPGRGYQMAWVHFQALRGKGVRRKLGLPLNLIRGCMQAWQAIRQVRPDVVLGMGGYISFPGGLMTVLTGRKLIVHEQNSIAGLANRVLSMMARKVLAGFPQTLSAAEWVGNPVRAEIATIAEPTERFAGREGALRLLVVGGSLGAAVFNEVVPLALSLLPPERRPQVVHQAGEKQFEMLRSAYAKSGVEGDLRPFIEDMAQAYAEADLVVCRSGALTVAELAAAGVASLLVPFPHAVDDHQTCNARFLAEQNAALLLPQSDLNAERLAELLMTLDRGGLLDMAKRARALAKPSAAEAVANVCEQLSGIRGEHEKAAGLKK